MNRTLSPTELKALLAGSDVLVFDVRRRAAYEADSVKQSGGATVSK